MRKRNKKLLAILLTMICTLSSVACSVPETEKKETQSKVTQAEQEEKKEMNEEVQKQDQINTEEEKIQKQNKINAEEKETEKNSIHNTKTEGLAMQLVAAVYPEMAQYPQTDGFIYEEDAFEAWRNSLQAQRPTSTEYKKGIREFCEETMQEFLKDTEGKNRIYSPLNVYMALAMLAETTEGESRAQILELLHTDSIETLRRNAPVLWNANYCDDGTMTSILANSIWLSDTMNYKEDTLKTLAQKYFSSSFRGTMGSVEYNKMLQTWLNEQTGGLLEKQASCIEMDPQTAFALASTVYFRAKWDKEFSKDSTTQEVFHMADKDVMTEFMHQSGSNYYYWGERFCAITRELSNSGEMLLILPEKETGVEELLEDLEVLEFIYNHHEWENKKYMIVNQSIPKFDVDSDYSLIEGLKNLGVVNVFDEKKSDFTPLTTDTKIGVDGATHAARVMIDEEGCIAAAFTVIVAYGASRPPEEKVDFVLNRPFLFVINGQDGQPLFVGIVNQPNQITD